MADQELLDLQAELDRLYQQILENNRLMGVTVFIVPEEKDGL